MLKQKGKIQEEQTFIKCTLCGDPADLQCSRCQQAYYCKVQHQKADWKKHSRGCKSFEVRIKDHYELKKLKMGQIFLELSKGEVGKAIALIGDWIVKEREFLLKYPGVQNQIEYGSTICLYIRFQIFKIDYNGAQDIWREYMSESQSFLLDVTNIPQKFDEVDMEKRKKQMNITFGKIRLLSTLFNLRQDLTRDAINIIQILIHHIQRVYGPESLELSNLYFQTGNYCATVLKQYNRALACFLKCAKFRKQYGGTAYYNAGLILKSQKYWKEAMDYFYKALTLIEKQKNPETLTYLPQIFENIALCYQQFGVGNKMIEYFEKALFCYQSTKNIPKSNAILALFKLLKHECRDQLQGDDTKLLQFPKQKKDKKPMISLTSKNYLNYQNADKPMQTENEQAKIAEWRQSFKVKKPTNIHSDIPKFPKEVELLFDNDPFKKKNQRQEEVPSYLVKNDQVGADYGLNLDLGYMKTLTSHQVGLLSQLNSKLLECKEKAPIYDVLESSNFYQTATNQKKNKFFKLNPHLIRPSDINRRIMISQPTQEEESHYDYSMQAQIRKENPKTPKFKKLDMEKVNQFRRLQQTNR